MCTEQCGGINIFSGLPARGHRVERHAGPAGVYDYTSHLEHNARSIREAIVCNGLRIPRASSRDVHLVVCVVCVEMLPITVLNHRKSEMKMKFAFEREGVPLVIRPTPKANDYEKLGNTAAVDNVQNFEKHFP